MALFFPRFVEEEDNKTLMEEVSEEELKEVLHSFQKDKSPGLDGWSMDFLVGLYDLIGKDILKVVEESKKNGHIHPPLNATFIALIPKKDDPQSLDDFRPISLCNCIYKVIAKIISRRIKSSSQSPSHRNNLVFWKVDKSTKQSELHKRPYIVSKPIN
jgi:hypothetical protein